MNHKRRMKILIFVVTSVLFSLVWAYGVEKRCHRPSYDQNHYVSLVVALAQPLFTDQDLDEVGPAIEQRIANYLRQKTVRTLEVVGSPVISDQTAGQRRPIILAVPMVDPKYVEYGNFHDLWEKIRRGHVPSSQEFWLALADVLDGVTKGYFPEVSDYKIRPHYRFLRIELEKRSWQSIQELPIKLDRSVIDIPLGWFKVHHKEIEIKSEATEETAFDVWLVKLETFEPGPELMNVGLNEKIVAALVGLKPDSSETWSVIRQVKTRNNMTAITERGHKSHHVIGFDLGDWVGANHDPTKSETVTSFQGTTTVQVIKGEDVIAGYERGVDLSPQALTERGAVLLDEKGLTSDPSAQNAVIDPGGYKEGYAGYSPIGGGLVNLAAKSDLGVEVTGMDYFWAGFDTITVPAVGIVAIGKVGLRVASKEALEAASKEGVKKLAKNEVAAKALTPVSTAVKQTSLTNAPFRTGAPLIKPVSFRGTLSTFQGKQVLKRNDAFDPLYRDALRRTNVERMQNRLAPIGRDGNPLNLHHEGQKESGRLIELTASEHRMIPVDRAPSEIDRAAFDKWRSDYWPERATDFAGVK